MSEHVLDVESARKKPPNFVPFVLIGLGSLAILGPIVLLRRTRPDQTSRHVKSLSNAPPPVRRAAAVAPSRPSLAQSPLVASSLSPPKSVSATADTSSQEGGSENATHAIDPLQALKAFGIATIITTAGALFGVFAVKKSMGIESVEQFADRMRSKFQTWAPTLSARVYRHHPNSEDVLATSTSKMTSSVNSRSGIDHVNGWNWNDASERLSEAYSQGDFSRWLEAATKELEREADIERKRRGLPVSQSTTEIK